MEREVLRTAVKLCLESLLFSTIIAVAIAMFGYIKQWDSAVTYSNAFFLAGCLVIIGGWSSRLAASQESGRYHLYAESFRGMSRSEQINYIVDVSGSLRLVIVGMLSGLTLILLSAIAAILS